MSALEGSVEMETPDTAEKSHIREGLRYLSALPGYFHQTIHFKDAHREQQWTDLQKRLHDLQKSFERYEMRLPEDDKSRLTQLWATLKAKHTFSASELKRTDLKRLCQIPEIVADDTFDHLLKERQQDLPSGALFGLVQFCHHYWNDRVHLSLRRRDFLCGIIKDQLNTVRGGGILTCWKENASLLFSPQATERLAEILLNADESLTQLAETYRIETGSGLMQETRRRALTQWVEQITERTNPSDEELTYGLDTLLHAEDVSEIARLLAYGDRWAVARERIKTWCLQQFGDPRIPGNSRWVYLSDGCRDTVLRWLSEEDLIFFFECIMRSEDDRHYRRPFWARYISQVHFSRVLMSEEDRLLNRDTLMRMQAEGKTLPGRIRGSLQASSAFWMELGPFIIIEFKDNNAAYVYSMENIPDWLLKIKNNLFVESVAFTVQDFKFKKPEENTADYQLTKDNKHWNTPPFSFRHSHYPTWWETVDYWLQRQGIYPSRETR